MNQQTSISSLDFDGDYGLQYRSSIRGSIAGYETFLELAASSVKSQCQKASHCLVIGPGAGEELTLLLQVLPKAQFTLVEPSEQMRSFCMKELEKINATARCSWIPSSLTKARQGLTAKSFDAVIALNLMHLFPPAEQIEAFDQLGSLVAPGGAMLRSSYSEDQNKLSNDLIVSIATERLRIRGLNEEQIKMILSARNQSVFSFDPINLPSNPKSKDLGVPLQIMQVGLIRMWLWIRASTGA